VFKFKELLKKFTHEIRQVAASTTEASSEAFHRHVLLLLQNFAERAYQIPTVQRYQLVLFVYLLFNNLDMAVGKKHPYLDSTEYLSLKSADTMHTLLEEWGLTYKTDFEEGYTDI
jgi:hypothetical protein